MQDENQTEPGAVIQPGSVPDDAVAPSDSPQEEQSAATPSPQQPEKSPEPQQAMPITALKPPQKTDEPAAANWKFHDDDPTSDSTVSAQPIKPVEWTASEFIEHSKSIGWYAILALGTVVFATTLYLLTKDKVATGAVVIVALTFGILANHKPRELAYAVDEMGIHIGEKSYPYANFKSFALVQENAVESIWLMPLKRFMPILTIYFDPQDEEKITDVLSAYLPLENHELDPVDKLLHKIRF